MTDPEDLVGGIISRKTLYKKMVASRYAIDGDIMRHAKFDVHEYLVNQLLVGLRSFILEDQLAPDKVKVDLEKPWEQDVTFDVRVPASWWQQLKNDCFPSWARRRPVKTKVLSFTRHVSGTVKVEDEIVIERSLTYPEANVAIPGDQWGKPVYVESLRVPWED